MLGLSRDRQTSLKEIVLPCHSESSIPSPSEEASSRGMSVWAQQRPEESQGQPKEQTPGPLLSQAGKKLSRKQAGSVVHLSPYGWSHKCL